MVQFELGAESCFVFPLQPAPITRILCDLHSRMQIFESSSISLHIQFESEIAVPLALEVAERTTRRIGTPSTGLDRLSRPVLHQRRSVPNPPFQVEQGRRAALMPGSRRPQVTVKFVKRHLPVHTEFDVVIMLSNRELLTTPNSLS